MLADRFIAEVDLANVSTLHTFLPNYKAREPDTWLIIHHLWQYHPHIQIVVPRVNPGDLTMDCLLLSSHTTFAENRYGIYEPEGDAYVDPETIDIVLTPLLAFDLQGYRVGYGKGYYDRFFVNCKKKISRTGLSFFEPVSCISDTDPYDIPLSQAITPSQQYCFYSDN